jgi:threonine aldolase
LYVDGARLGYALACEKNEIDLPTLAQYTDVFYIGGTKVGSLFGEAVVFTKKNAPKHLDTIIKMHGALLAKGRLLGLQFDTLFTDNLYQKLGKNAIDCAMLLKNEMIKKGYKIYLDSYTNLQYFILNNKKIEELEDKAYFYIIKKCDDNNSLIRLVTSWATKKEDIIKFIDFL